MADGRDGQQQEDAGEEFKQGCHGIDLKAGFSVFFQDVITNAPGAEPLYKEGAGVALRLVFCRESL